MPFPKGESGNPGGRPKTGALSKAYREVLEQPVTREALANLGLTRKEAKGLTFAKAIALNLALRAISTKDPVFAAKELADRAEGKAPQAIDLGLQPGMFEGDNRTPLVDLLAKVLGRNRGPK